MNWKQIVVFTLVLFGFSAAYGFILGFGFAKFYTADQDVPVWLMVIQELGSLILTTAIFTSLSMRQTIKPFVHAFIVFFLSNLISLTMLCLLIVELNPLNLIGVTVLNVICLLVGTQVGIDINKKRSWFKTKVL